MKKRLFLATCTLALVSCADAGEAPADQPESTEAAPAETPAATSGGADSPAPGAEDKQAADAIPNRFIGVWDYIKGTCDPASDMRLEIDRHEFGFYESRGKVTAVRNEGEATVVDLDMSGEGETWQQTLRLVLKDDGTRLHITEPQDESDEDDYPRRRCPA